jgi:hypothetical protein
MAILSVQKKSCDRVNGIRIVFGRPYLQQEKRGTHAVCIEEALAGRERGVVWQPLANLHGATICSFETVCNRADTLPKVSEKEESYRWPGALGDRSLRARPSYRQAL